MKREKLSPVYVIKQVFGPLYINKWSLRLIESLDIATAKKMSLAEASDFLAQLEADARFRGMYKIVQF